MVAIGFHFELWRNIYIEYYDAFFLTKAFFFVVVVVFFFPKEEGC